MLNVNSENHALSNTVAVIPAYNEERFIASVVFLTKQYAATVIVVAAKRISCLFPACTKKLKAAQRAFIS
ncbi:hypothetical protein [Sulfobacillus thermotolerans]|uniref:hypothetical protein n=1 Tax=Sulfobacillus thermotolerans TaxID=338644 RepID=UPI003368B0BA